MLDGDVPLLEIWIRQLVRRRENARLRRRRTVLECCIQTELRDNWPIVLHIEMNERRIQSEQEQAVAYREHVVKNAVPRARDQISYRPPRDSDAWRKIVVVGGI